MAHYYINLNPGIGYVVTQLERDYDWLLGSTSVVNFGDRQSDAIEFRDDCNNGVIDERRIKLLMKTYTNQPYKYMGKGVIKTQKNYDRRK